MSWRPFQTSLSPLLLTLQPGHSILPFPACLSPCCYLTQRAISAPRPPSPSWALLGCHHQKESQPPGYLFLGRYYNPYIGAAEGKKQVIVKFNSSARHEALPSTYLLNCLEHIIYFILAHWPSQPIFSMPLRSQELRSPILHLNYKVSQEDPTEVVSVKVALKQLGVMETKDHQV